MLTRQSLAAYFDHTVLKADATKEQVLSLCKEAREHNFFGICVNTSLLETAAKALEGTNVKKVVVVGFPLAACLTEVKAYETKRAVELGADEVDTVLHIGAFKDKDYDYCEQDIRKVVEAAGGKLVKVILETGYLDASEIEKAVEISVRAGAHYVKTSTGFGPRGASLDDIKTMKATLDKLGANEIGIKASGGIKDLEFCKKLIDAGATRIGASASCSILDEL
jgi:deoxyribose-phosphate aldolase